MNNYFDNGRNQKKNKTKDFLMFIVDYNKQLNKKTQFLFTYL